MEKIRVSQAIKDEQHDIQFHLLAGDPYAPFNLKSCIMQLKSNASLTTVIILLYVAFFESYFLRGIARNINVDSLKHLEIYIGLRKL